MLGAVIGDIIGSVYEFHNVKTKDFPLWTPASTFTDDTVCTVAVADAMMRQIPFDVSLRHWCRRYPNVGYGARFQAWVSDEAAGPYKSWGNGAIMRLSPVGFLSCDHIYSLLSGFEATGVTHNSAEAITATEAYLDAFWNLKHGVPEAYIKDALSRRYGYAMNRTVDEIRVGYDRFYVRCAKTVPEAIVCALEATGFEDAVRNAVSLGGDSDTLAAMTGALAEVRFGVPPALEQEARQRIDAPLMAVLDKMYQTPQKIIRQRLSYHPVTGVRQRMD